MVNIQVKWGKEQYEIEMDQSESVQVFKTQLWTLTNIPIDKQKIMGLKGGILKDDTVLSTMQIPEGTKLTLIGTPEEKQFTPATVEATADIASSLLSLINPVPVAPPTPAGLKNLENTCYLNSVVQFLNSVLPLSKHLQNQSPSRNSPQNSILLSLSRTLSSLSHSSSPVIPLDLVASLRSAYPQFAQMKEGHFIQHDAEECLNIILSSLASLPSPTSPQSTLVDDYFSLDLEVTSECIENPAVPKEEVKEHTNKLSLLCGSPIVPVDSVYSSLKLSLEETITKRITAPNSTEEASFTFKKTSRLASLPPFLILHLVRFEWKRRNELARTDAGKAKICKKITLPQSLDLFEFCSGDLKKSLAPVRDVLSAPPGKREREEEEGDGDVAMTEEKGGEKEERFNGCYDFLSVVTHQGRQADGGHYVAWRKEKDGKDAFWMKFDDDKVSEMNEKDFDVQGGRADYHIAYLVMYKRRDVVLTPEQERLLLSRYGREEKEGEKIETEEKNVPMSMDL